MPNKKKPVAQGKHSPHPKPPDICSVETDTSVDSGSNSNSRGSNKTLTSVTMPSAWSVRGRLALGPGSEARRSDRCILIVRNSEDAGKVFANWTQKSFVNGEYKRTNMNLPENVPSRIDPAQAFARDPPLTEVGAFLAENMGSAIAEAGVSFTAIYTSPALRCIQTAQNLLKCQPKNSSTMICVEPGLFEYNGSDSVHNVPLFMTKDELRTNKFSIDGAYKPHTDLQHLYGLTSESIIGFYERQAKLLSSLMAKHPSGTVLVVTHAITMHALVRALLRTRRPASVTDTHRVSFYYPYCTGIVFEPSAQVPQRWRIAPNLLPHFNASFFANRFNQAFVQHMHASSDLSGPTG